MSKYLGIQAQQRRNNFNSMLLLLLFPMLLLALAWGIIFVFCHFGVLDEEQYVSLSVAIANEQFLDFIPFILGGCVVWFLIAYFFNVQMIRSATGAKPLERKENKRVYNLVENLCIGLNIPMPKINIIEDSSLNAFASGINQKSYTITLSRGIIERLSDEELEGVIAHEMTHIINRDVRVLIISIIFVGIFSFIAQMALRMVWNSGSSSRSNKNGKSSGGTIILFLMVLAFAGIAYFLSMLMRFAISRKREYMADAGAAEMTRKPWALASALRKIARDPRIEAVDRQDVAQLFIENPLSKKARGLFATHPHIMQRIKVLDEF